MPSGGVVITLPDGTSVHSGDADAATRVSAAIDHPVTLWPLAPADDLDHYRRGAADSDDMMAELRGIFGRVEGEPLPDLSIFPPVIAEFESPPGTYLDAFPLMIMSTSALAFVAAGAARQHDRRAPVPAELRRRHRRRSRPPRVRVVGTQAAVGDAVIEIDAPCPRCVMVTREVDDDDSPGPRRAAPHRARPRPEPRRVRHCHHPRRRSPSAISCASSTDRIGRR